MCRASSEVGGPRRCSGDTRDKYSRAGALVAELERSEATLMEGIRQRSELDSRVAIEAAGYVQSWMESHQISEIRVDDEHETPGYALDFDDDVLAVAISWLPPGVIHNPTHPAWNPVVRLSDLRAFLARNGGAERHRDSPDGAAERLDDGRATQPSGPVAESACSCHVVRDFAGGHFGSLASIGAECGHCQSLNARYEHEQWWESLTPQERATAEIQGRWFQARERLRALGRRPGAPPAIDCPF